MGEERGGGGGVINLAIGVALALCAVFLLTLRAYGFRWAADLASDLSDNRERENDRYLELFGVVVGITISSLATLPFVALIGFMRNEPLSSDAMMYGAAGGLVLGSLGTVCWRMANLISTNLEINVMNYLTPTLALIWLFAFSQVGEISVGYLLIGVAAIVLANVGVYLETRGQSQESDDAPAREPIDIDALIAGGETETVEFKSTLRFDLRNKKDKADYIEHASLKTLAAFLNTDGGTLVIGVSDGGETVSEEDGEPLEFDTGVFENEDKMALHLTEIVSAGMTGGRVAMPLGLVHSKFYDYRGSKVLAVRCEPATDPTFVNYRGKDLFYVRRGPSTVVLSGSDEVEYIRKRFRFQA